MHGRTAQDRLRDGAEDEAKAERDVGEAEAFGRPPPSLDPDDRECLRIAKKVSGVREAQEARACDSRRTGKKP